jgi:hypothetical protein
MRSRKHGILNSALTGGLELELTYRAPTCRSGEQSERRVHGSAYGESDELVLHVAFLLGNN